MGRNEILWTMGGKEISHQVSHQVTLTKSLSSSRALSTWGLEKEKITGTHKTLLVTLP